MEITANAAANAGSVLSAGVGRGKNDGNESKKLNLTIHSSQ